MYWRETRQGEPKMIGRIRAALLATWAAFAALPAGHAQLLPLTDSSLWPGLSKDDVDRLTAASSRLYEGGSIGTVERWRNPDTGNAGAVRLARTFEFHNMPCRRLDYTMRYAKGAKAPGRYAVTWCKIDSGEWKVVDTKPPATP